MVQERSPAEVQTEAKTEETRQFVRQVRKVSRRKLAPDEKVRIVLEGFRGEVRVSELCRREAICGSTGGPGASNPRLPDQKSEILPLSQQLNGIKSRRPMCESVWRRTKVAPTTCLRRRRSSGGDPCRQVRRIVNQDVVARGILQTVPHSLVASPNSSARQPSRYG